MLACENVGDRIWLAADLEEPCMEGRHLLYFILLCLPQILLWLLGLPLGALLILHRHKKNLMDKRIQFKWGLLFSGYRIELWWWEMTIVIRKVCMVVVGGVFGSRLGPDMQVYMALFLVVVFIVVHLAARPFDELTSSHKILHWLELSALLICWGTLYSGMLFWLGTTAGRLGPAFLTLVSFTIIFGNVLFTIWLVFVFVRAVTRESKKDGTQSEDSLRKLIRIRSEDRVKTAGEQRVKVRPQTSQHQAMNRVGKSNKWSSISVFKLGQSMGKAKSQRSGRTVKRGDTRKIASDVQKLSRVTSTAHRKKTHQRKSAASNRLQQRLDQRSMAVVSPVPVHQEEQDQQQKSTLKNDIIALKWQKNIRQTLVNNNKAPKMSRTPSRMQQNRTWRTQRVEEIQQTHQNHRNLALESIERQHSQRRTSLQLRVEARNKNKEMAKRVALRGNETEVEKVLAKKDKQKQMAAPDDGLDNSVITKESRRQTGRLKRQTSKDMFGAQEKGVTLDVMPSENRRHSGRLKRRTANEHFVRLPPLPPPRHPARLKRRIEKKNMSVSPPLDVKSKDSPTTVNKGTEEQAQLAVDNETEEDAQLAADLSLTGNKKSEIKTTLSSFATSNIIVGFCKAFQGSEVEKKFASFDATKKIKFKKILKLIKQTEELTSQQEIELMKEFGLKNIKEKVSCSSFLAWVELRVTENIDTHS